ncbi:MAG: RibD family protein, partial [Verrucomicrobiota bacterium]|nr:RibD family protein [Verrucomicrobiota bacterium]
TGLPWVIAKAGMSIDGRLTRPAEEGQWLTCRESLADAQKVRGEVDAILVGAGTVRADDPKLTIRDSKILKRGKEQPWRVILTRSGKLPDNSQVFTDRFTDRTLLYKRKSLKAVLKDLAGKYNCMNVMIEGGGKLLGEAFRKQLVDEVCFYIAPILCGNKCTPVADIAFPSSAQLCDITVKRIGEDLRVRGLVRD